MCIYIKHNTHIHIYTEGSNVLDIVLDTGDPEGNKRLRNRSVQVLAYPDWLSMA